MLREGGLDLQRSENLNEDEANSIFKTEFQDKAYFGLVKILIIPLNLSASDKPSLLRLSAIFAAQNYSKIMLHSVVLPKKSPKGRNPHEILLKNAMPK